MLKQDSNDEIGLVYNDLKKLDETTNYELGTDIVPASVTKFVSKKRMKCKIEYTSTCDKQEISVVK